MNSIKNEKLTCVVRPERMALIGLGGAGGAIIGMVAERLAAGPVVAAVNTDYQALERCCVPTKVQIGARLTRGLGAGGDPAKGRTAVEEEAVLLNALCAGKDVVVIVAGLGGGTGSGAMPSLVRIAHENNAIALCVATMPFDYEGDGIRRLAGAAISELRGLADAVLIVPNQRLFADSGSATPLDEAFVRANAVIADGITGLWQMLVTQGFMHVTLADIRAAALKTDGILALGCGAASGPERAERAAKQAIASPLLDGGRILRAAETVLVSIVGGPETSFAEIEQVVAVVRGAARPGVQLKVGPTLTAPADSRLCVTLMAPNACEEGPQDRVAPAATATAADGTAGVRPVQAQLQFESVSQGRFKDVDPTMHDGQNLDVPTWKRRGLVIDK